MTDDHIGRGENRVKQVLQRLFGQGTSILSQVHIQGVINPEEYSILGKEHNQHKFDLVVKFGALSNRPDIVVEVNYKHGSIPVKKWNNVYFPAILNANKIPLTIEDRECKSIFDKKHERPLKWEDFEDVISALKMARIQP